MGGLIGVHCKLFKDDDPTSQFLKFEGTNAKMMKYQEGVSKASQKRKIKFSFIS